MTHIDLAVSNDNFSYEMHADLAGVTVLFGPSGVGKTTVLRTIAGFTPEMRGTVTYAGETLQNSMIGAFVPPHKRGIATVFQDSRLFPHMTVARNLGYAAKRAPKINGPDLDTVVQALDLVPLLGQLPETLSGGEKQRVAIGRALLTRPKLILMDEPLASLDTDRKQDILPYVAALPTVFGLPVLYVTHAVPEVAQIATQVLRMTSGTVASAVSPATFLGEQGPEAVRVTATITKVENGLTYLSVQGQTLTLEGDLGPKDSQITLNLTPNRN